MEARWHTFPPFYFHFFEILDPIDNQAKTYLLVDENILGWLVHWMFIKIAIEFTPYPWKTYIKINCKYILNNVNVTKISWWRHQMEIFSALLAICAGNSPVTGEFPTQRPVTRSFDVYFDLRPNERLSKQWWGWWFETLSRSLWRHRNDYPLCQTRKLFAFGRRHCLLFVFWKVPYE